MDPNKIILWNIQTFKEIIILKGHHGSLTNLIFNKDGTILFSSSCDDTIKLWDT